MTSPHHVAEIVNVARFVAPGIAATLLGVSRTTLIRWEAEGKITPRRLFGGHRRYLLSDLRSVLTTESQDRDAS